MMQKQGGGDRGAVVGIDGSPQSDQALDWAAEWAAATGHNLHAVSAWTIPARYGWYMGPEPPEGWDLEAAVRKTAEEQIDRMRARHPGVAVDLSVVPGHPAHVLVEESRHADLLVVGSRGHGGFTGMLLGSVSSHCAHAAHCPVVVIRGHRSGDAAS